MASTLKQLLVSKGQNTSTSQGSSQAEVDLDPKEKLEAVTDQDSTLAAPPQSPSPEAEYDKLLVSSKITFTACSAFWKPITS